MAGFDDGGIFFSDNFGSEDTQNDSQVNLQAVKSRFRDFLRQFHEGNFNYRYRYRELVGFYTSFPTQLLFPKNFTAYFFFEKLPVVI